MRSPICVLVALAVTPLFVALPARAVDSFEIQVYDGEINEPLQTGTELHSNFTAAGRNDPAFAGEVVPDRLLRVTLEPSFGILTWWEVGVYLQTAFQPGEPDGHFAGFKLRSKFIIPRQRTGEFILGLNIELGRGVAALGTAHWDTEIRPIIAWLRGRWILAVNPIIGWALTGDRHAAPHLEPAFKVRIAATQHLGLGLEYYADMGVLSAVPAADRQEHFIYAIGDLLNGPIDLNVGVGRGLTGASDVWTIKTILGHTF